MKPKYSLLAERLFKIEVKVEFPKIYGKDRRCVNATNYGYKTNSAFFVYFLKALQSGCCTLMTF